MTSVTSGFITNTGRGILMSCVVGWSLTAAQEIDTLALPKDSVHHLFIAQKLNAIEFYHKAAVEPFFTKWRSDTVTRLTIAHFGDSHVQPGVFTGEVRSQLQAAKGYGGVGVVFPYSAAKTYSPLSYKTVHYGRWLMAKGLEPRPKLPLGVSGMTIRTYDSAAGFSITFKEPLPDHYRKLKLFFRGGTNSYDFRLLAGQNEILVPASMQHADVPYSELILRDTTSSIHIQLLKTGKEQSQFEFYGISWESVTGQGLVLHSLGVGGARFGSVLAEVLLDSQLPALAPDLVVLDFGTNDFLYDQRIPNQLEREITQTIQWIRQLVPGVTIMLTSTQDMDRYGVNVAAAAEFSSLIRRVARRERCALYDWFRISGGQYTMSKWVEDGLARTDHIHLTKDGYLLKGKLFAAALEQTLEAYFSEPGLDSLVLSNPVSDSIGVDSIIRERPKPPTTVTTRHMISSGESLSTIAQHYRVKVADIMRVNRLSSTRIVAGQYLRIEYNPARLSQQPGRPVDKNLIRYKVVSGDTLSEIAERFNVPVREIRKLNDLHGSRIVVGKTLLIRDSSKTK